MAALAVLALSFAPAASADWRAVPSPGGEIQLLEVASAGTWLVQTSPAGCCGHPTLELTEDGGLTWVPVSITGYTFVIPIGPAPDHSFRIAAIHASGSSGELQLFRVSAAEGAQPLGPPVANIDQSSYGSGFVVAEDGSTWIAYLSTISHEYELAVIGADGSLASTVLPDQAGTASWSADQTVFGTRLVRIDQEELTKHIPPAGGTFKLNGQGEVVPAERYPVIFVDGDTWLSDFERGSWDGGAHWTEGRYPLALATAPGVSPRYLVWEGKLAERYSPSLFRETALQWPAGVLWGAAVDAGTALIARGDTEIYVWEGALPQLPTEIGSLPPDARALISRANLFRADAGLPPLTGDERLSAAAYAHSRYTALNKSDPDLGHSETTGRPGFTGVDPTSRCIAAGTSCNGEVMYSPVPDPVAGWLATPFHRPLLGAPQAGVVGAGVAEGGWAVMDSGARQNLLIKPFGYPVGRWRGEEGFSGESPDPVAACHASGQAIGYPVGIAVSLYLPSENASVSQIEVRKRGAAAALPGCLLQDDLAGSGAIGHFILDDPISAGQTYEVKALWNTGTNSLPGGATEPGATLSERWSFTYEPDPLKAARRCRPPRSPRVKAYAPRQRRSHQRQVKGVGAILSPRAGSTVQVASARLSYRPRAAARATKVVALKVKKAKALRAGARTLLRLRLPSSFAHRLTLGTRVRLKLKLRLARDRGCASPETLQRSLAPRVVLIPRHGRLLAPYHGR